MYEMALDADGKLKYSPWDEDKVRSEIIKNLGGGLVTFGSYEDPVVTAPLTARELPREIRADFTYTFLTLPRLLSLTNGNLNLSARAIMRIE
jgi:hypothetical protein